MRRALPFILIFILLLIPTVSFSQSAPASTDSQTLQELLREVRQLRQDMRNITVTSQRAQILLSREQLQQTSVESAQKEADAAKARTQQTDDRARRLAMQVKYYTDADNEDATPNPAERQPKDGAGASTVESRAGTVERRQCKSAV